MSLYRPAQRGRSRATGLQAVEAQIVREKAEALGRAGERLEEALNELKGMRGMDVERCYRVSERVR